MKVVFDLGKKDFIWIGMVFVLVSVGVVYAYNSEEDPSVMGHDAGELDFEIEIFTAPSRTHTEHKFTNVGVWKFCSLSAIGDMDNQEHCWIERNGDNSWEIHTEDTPHIGDYSWTKCKMVCFR